VILSELTDEALIKIGGDYLEYKYGKVPIVEHFRAGQKLDHWSGLGAILSMRESAHKDMRLLAGIDPRDKEWLFSRAYTYFLDPENRKWYYDGTGVKRY